MMTTCCFQVRACLLLVVWIFSGCSATITRGLGSQDEVNLVEFLFKNNNYNPLIRPVKNVSDALTITFSLALSQIINVDEKNQIMKTNVWLQLYWKDYQLMWDPEKYGGIENIRIHPDYVWKPDIVLFNNADGNYEVTYRSNVVLGYNGHHYWIPPAIYKSSCSIDVQFFPFDQQECEMKFGSWTFKGDQLNFTFYNNVNYIDMADYLLNGAWDIIDCPGRIETFIEPGSKDLKTMVIFKFVLRRKTLFYTINLIIPCVLISFVSVCVFALPADAGEKITLCISILLALVVFLLLISKILPPSLTIPLIAKYLLFTFIMNIFAIVCTVVVINRNYRTPRTHSMPSWVRYVFLYWLPKVLFMERPDHDERWRRAPTNNLDDASRTLDKRAEMSAHAPGTPANIPSNVPSSVLELTEVHHPNCRLSPKSTPEMTPDDCPRRSVIKLSSEILKASESLKFITQHLQEEDEYMTVLDDWKYIALVIDRLLLFVFIIVTFFGTLWILLQPPHILDTVDQEEILRQMRSKWI